MQSLAATAACRRTELALARQRMGCLKLYNYFNYLRVRSFIPKGAPFLDCGSSLRVAGGEV
jgi:hypothetical protein